jgi:hypothetical protein
MSHQPRDPQKALQRPLERSEWTDPLIARALSQLQTGTYWAFSARVNYCANFNACDTCDLLLQSIMPAW